MNDALEKFNHTIDTWIRIVDDHSFEALIQKPIPGSWSLGQVIVHIIEDTPWHVGQMREALATDANAGKDMHDDAKEMFRKNMFPDMQIEGASTNDSVPQPVSKEALLQQLTSIREDVNTLFGSTDFSTSTGKTRHPGLLFFTALDWLRFTEMHMRHHLRQKKRIEDALRIRS